MSYIAGGGEPCADPGGPEDLEDRLDPAIRLRREGQRPVDVARMLGVDRRSVRRWNAAHPSEGREGIEVGRTRVARIAQRREAPEPRQLLLEGGRAAGSPADLWTCPRIASGY